MGKDDGVVDSDDDDVDNIQLKPDTMTSKSHAFYWEYP